MKKGNVIKTTVVTNEVAWSDGKPTKYQSVAAYHTDSGRTMRILGDPMPDPDKAEDSLCEELELWHDAVQAMIKEFEKGGAL